MIPNEDNPAGSENQTLNTLQTCWRSGWPTDCVCVQPGPSSLPTEGWSARWLSCNTTLFRLTSRFNASLCSGEAESPLTGHHSELKHLLACFAPEQTEQRGPSLNFPKRLKHTHVNMLARATPAPHRACDIWWGCGGVQTVPAGGYLPCFDPWPACSAVLGHRGLIVSHQSR